MTRLSAAPPDVLNTSKPLLDQAAAVMGFTPNSLKIMARSPELIKGFMMLSLALMGPAATLAPQLRQMIAHITSAAAGCNYCKAHTAHGAERLGLPVEKIENLWNFETSPHFNAAERAALSLAQAAGSVPNAATDRHFSDLKQHFSEDQIAEIVGVISYFGFLNRWNDTLATPLEESPLGFAEAHLAHTDWEAGKHG
ncbi:MAG: carboxymuconolactone decarboxylase family protein [Hyphomonadaceae bacterium]